MLPGDRLVCAFIEPQENFARFVRWPLHVTVIPWFRVGEDSRVIADGLQQALAGVAPFEAHMGGAAYFGLLKNRPVRLILRPTPFEQIEAKVRNYLHKKRALLVDETTKRRHDFRPHVTDQGSTGLKESDAFHCAAIYIVEQRGDHKEIAQKFPLEDKVNEQ